ncbi:MAG: CHASE2 domain-containing protein [Candidatus Methylomirabilales bacterium]
MGGKVWPVLKAVFIAVAAFVAMLVLTKLPLLSLLELKGLDLLFLLRGPLRPPNEVVVVAIDEPSFAEISVQWPWPRSLHARLIEQLKKAGAKVIGFDVLFAERSEPAEDKALQRAIREAGNVVLVSERAVIDDPLYRHTIRVDPIVPFKEAAAVGITTQLIDSDGAVRRARLLSPDMPSFTFQIVRLYLADRPEVSREIRIDPYKEVLINHVGPPRSVKTVSYYQALEYDRMLPPGIFAGKIVLVGRSLQAAPEPQRTAPDTFRTPYSLFVEGPTPGVEIHATIVSNLLGGNFVAELSPVARLGVLLLLALVGSLILLKLRPLGGLAVTVALSVLFLVITYAVFAGGRLWLPVFAGTILLGLVYGGHLMVRALSAERERRLFLEESNRNLEEKVKERTAELSTANQELKERHQELEEAYQELARTQDQLLQSEKMASLGLLVAGVAHELNNPIGFIHSNVDFIGEYVERLRGIIEAYEAVDIADGPARRRVEELKKRARLDFTLKTLDELIASCREGTERVKKIVIDLRAFSRTDDVGPMRVDLQEGIETTLSLLTNEYKDRIDVHREYGYLPKVECFPGQVNQVFMNLLLNAAQAISGRGDVWIKTSSHGDRATIAIKDNGCGIPEKDLPKIFDPFFTTKRVGEGTGLGLSITYGIIKKHGGSIRVTSQVGKGTEFTVDIPLRLIGG